MLRKTITRGHGVGHRITHFETNGVAVVGHRQEAAVELPVVSKMVQ